MSEAVSKPVGTGEASPYRPHIFVGIPTVDGRIEYPIAMLLASLAILQSQGVIRLTTRVVSHVSPVAFARNKIVKDFRASDAERLWMIDADGVPPKNALDLLGIEGDIVSAACPVWADRQGFYLNGYRRTPQGYRPVPLTGRTQSVDVVGFASVILSRRLLTDPRMDLPPERIMRPWSDTPYEDQAPGVFRMRYATDGSIVVGEDIDFCERARALDYKVLFAPQVQFGHVKQLDLARVLTVMGDAYAQGREDEKASAEAAKPRIILP